MKKELLFIIVLLLITACSSPQEAVVEQPTSDEPHQVPFEMPETEEPVEEPVVELTDLKALLPELSDFDSGWRIVTEKTADVSEWDPDRQDVMGTAGFKQGYLISFVKGGETVGDFRNLEKVSFRLASYKDASALLDDGKENIEIGERTHIYNEDGYTDSITLIYGEIDNPNIGEDSLFYVYFMKEDPDEFRSYFLEFVDKNIHVEMDCLSFDAQGNRDDKKARANCLKYAKIVDGKI
ncbi:hypothetical protein ACFL6I_26900 [candidate division KSB1 bacterium]